MTNTLLDGYLVVEIGRTRAAANAGKHLADAGAQVVALQDEQRLHNLTEAARIYLDSAKDVVTWEQGHDKTLVDDLIAHADLVITDLPTEELVRRGLDAETLRHGRPGSSYVALTFLGWETPENVPVGELSMQAESGLMHMVGHPDREPLSLPYGIGALQLGLHGAAAGATALYVGTTTGRGRLVEISGVDVLASYVRIYGAVANYYGIPLRRAGRRAPGSGGRYPFGLFPCKDGYVAMICRSEREWSSLLEMMGNPTWSDLDRYRDLYGIAVEYPDEVDALIEPWLAQHTRAELLDMAQKYAIPVAPVKTISEVVEDPQLREHRQFFDTVVTEDEREVVVPGRPWASPERRVRHRAARSLADVVGEPAVTNRRIEQEEVAPR
ncbi:CoA transferase [Nocardia jinanensis]|uniref:L-carnitine dehydratase n=1 Tax=Nocardia jinanensis TaxID=382504 RepID=A0A917RKZ5_9NOCA|nr:CoA transferase [Nocardia jinanensis]GGL11906.1 putative L-carnitine dehydratase [Nocardia jinanensis]